MTINSWGSSDPVEVAKGGSGASTLTGVLTGNGTSAFTVSAITDNTVIMGSTSNLVQDTTITVTDNGEMVNTSQPAFLAVLGSNQTNVTGNGTTYTIPFATEIFDQNSDYNTSTYVFTAPVTGRYAFDAWATLDNITSSTFGLIKIVTSNRTYDLTVLNPSNGKVSNGSFSIGGSILADMDAMDTAYVEYYSLGEGADNNTIAGNGTLLVTYFSGCLIC